MKKRINLYYNREYKHYIYVQEKKNLEFAELQTTITIYNPRKNLEH